MPDVTVPAPVDRVRSAVAALALAAVATIIVALHLLTVGNYGIFRDEFYYLACGRHLAWGYVDHPPIVALMARVSSLAGGSLPAIRGIPILLSGALVFLVGAIARRLGGGWFAQALSAMLVGLAPHFLFIFHILSMNSAEVTLWALASWLTIVALQSERRWPWLALGVVLGVGLLTKHTAAVFGAGLAAGLIVTLARRALRTPGPWAAGAIAAVVFAPHVLWQIAHGWPTAEFVRNARQFKIAEQSLGSFLGELVGMMGPLSLPIWAAGLWWLLRGRAGVVGRVLGICAVSVVLVFVVQRSKPYYATPIWPVLFAAGAIAFERWTANAPRWRYGITALLLAGAAAVAPLGLPVLPVDTYVAYQARLGMRPSSQERQELGVLPQHFADMHGWEELAQTISRVYQSLPDPEKPSARVFARNYGEAGALEYYARRYPLPHVISPHNNYWLWGPGPDGGTLIIVGGDRQGNARVFEQLEEVARTRCRYCMPYENDRPIWIGRGWKIPLTQLWLGERRFI